MEKYGTVQQATDASIMLRPIGMPVDLGKNTDTLSSYLIRIAS